MAEKKKRKGKKSKALIDRIIDWISDGKTLREFCRQENISHMSVYRWLDDDADFKLRFARAREKGFDVIAEECLEIAEDGTNDWQTRLNKDGSEDEVLNHEHVQRSKLRIETRLKLLAKWDPKRYGDKLDLTAKVDGKIETITRTIIDKKE